MTQTLRTAVETSLPAGSALEGLIHPQPVPGRRILRDDPMESLYVDGGEVRTHLVLVNEARPLLTPTSPSRVEGVLEGPFGKAWFTLRAVEAAGLTRVELSGTYEPKGLLLRLAPKRSARLLAEELRAGMERVLEAREAPPPPSARPRRAGAEDDERAAPTAS